MITISKLFYLSFFLLCTFQASAQLSIDVETGIVWNGYNDVRVPNATGDEFSLTDGTGDKIIDFYRLQLMYKWNERHQLSLLYAPLQRYSEGTFDQEVFFAGESFPANVLYGSIYKFNSYRITYRYDFSTSGNFRWGLGLTGKIRDAKIRIMSDNRVSEKTDVGFVPLINFMIEWHFSHPFSLLLDGDALASPFGQGRAEDVLLAIRYSPTHQASFKLGYRLLEGGADVDEVYNFTLFNYVLLGATFNLSR